MRPFTSWPRVKKQSVQLIVFFLLATLSLQAQISQPRIDSILQAYSAIHQFNGSALVIQQDKTVYEKSLGYQDAASKRLLTQNSIFQIGSLTKSFTAVLILKLAQQNKLSLSDPISTYLPDYPRGNEIRIKHLLTNSGGIYEKFRKPTFYNQLRSTHPFSTEEMLAFFSQEPLDFDPGTQFSYSNSGFDLLGIIIEKVTGSSYAQAMHSYIFKPLNMTSSGFDFSRLSNDNKTTPYAYLSSTKQIDVKAWNASLTFSSGGLYSSTRDLQKFYQGLTEFKLISKEALDQATTPFLGGYGFGWYIDSLQGDRVIDHGGNVEGSTSYFLMMPERQTCIILLANITSTSLEKVGNSIYAALQNKPYRIPQSKREIQLTEQSLLNYVGRFEVSTHYQVGITKEAGKLVMKLNDEPKMTLLAEGEDLFFIDDSDMILEFIRKGGKIDQVRIRQGLTTKVADKKE
ncbi:beta-lactamase family protein [Spirosoma sp. RP8]|uniref:Beta-lactamase family protein n=1 Tax=Spirosoma liriopis TaxID=2937440 RepID=A0ABT0HST2_9BACT|nr:serine hydrolase domain-containing protein [Spirosoma liriopis]MCK8495244.1 beta-lactamase family protein [Spirosoma liriopis]